MPFHGQKYRFVGLFVYVINHVFYLNELDGKTLVSFRKPDIIGHKSSYISVNLSVEDQVIIMNGFIFIFRWFEMLLQFFFIVIPANIQCYSYWFIHLCCKTHVLKQILIFLLRSTIVWDFSEVCVSYTTEKFLF